MPLTLIKQKPDFQKVIATDEPKLHIAEFFCNTIQGEGINAGVPATFLRLQGCTLKCVWCDTLDVWPFGNEYTIHEVLDLLDEHGIIEKFRAGQHLVLTGGSPLKQERSLIILLEEFYERFEFSPYVEVENECTLMPSANFNFEVNCWNNSPKLSNSGMKENIRIKPDVLRYLASQSNSWFKFVIQNENDWEEIKRDFLDPGYINKDQIILMPEGMTQDELNQSREFVADMAVRENVRFTDRLHVTIWNKKTGV